MMNIENSKYENNFHLDALLRNHDGHYCDLSSIENEMKRDSKFLSNGNCYPLGIGKKII